MASCDPNDLAQAAKCFQCLNWHSREAVKTYLLCQYANKSSGTTPAAPVAIDATNCAATSFTANWLASAGATSYRLDVSTSNVFAGFVPGYNDLNVGNVTAAAVTGLSANTGYYYRVRAVNAFGTSANSGTINFVTAPNAPTNLVIDPTTTNGNIILNWTQGAAPGTNEIWRSVNGGAYALIASIAGVNVTYTHAASLAAADQWYYEVRACNSSCCSAFTDPAGIFRDFFHHANTGLLTYSFPFLQFHIGNLDVSNQAAMTSFSAPKLHTCTGYLGIYDNPSMATITLTALISTGSFLQFSGSASLAALSLPALTTVGLYFAISSNSGLVSVSIPLLATIANTFYFNDTPVLASLSAPSLAFIAGDLNGPNSGIASLTMDTVTFIAGNITLLNSTSLIAVSFINLASVLNAIDASGCTLLATFDIPNLFITDGTVVDFRGDALLDTAVNLILARGIASGTTFADYELNNPGNAAPTGQGLTDKGDLITAGNTVTTN